MVSTIRFVARTVVPAPLRRGVRRQRSRLRAAADQMAADRPIRSVPSDDRRPPPPRAAHAATVASWRYSLSKWGRRGEAIAGLATLAGWVTCFTDPAGPIVLAVGCGLALASVTPMWATPASSRAQMGVRAAHCLGAALFFSAAVTATLLGNTPAGYAVIGIGYSTLLVRAGLMAWQARHGGLRHALLCGAAEVLPMGGYLRPRPATPA